MYKNEAGQSIGAQMVSASDGSAFTGTVTVYITGDGGTQAIGSVGSGICTHEGNGYHTYAPAKGETNYDLIAFTFVGSGAIPATVQIITELSLDALIGSGAVTSSTSLVTTTQAKAYMRKDEESTLEEVAEYVGMGDGETVAFTLDNTPVTGSLKLYVNGTLQVETTNFSISGTTITFVSAPTLNYPITANYQYAASGDTMEDYDDSLIEVMIAAATKLAEEYTGRAFIQREITEYHYGKGEDIIKLRRQPVSSISTVTYSRIVNNTGDGSTVAFSLGYTPKTDSLTVYVDDVEQTETTDYTLSSSTVTFTSAPADEAKIIFRFEVRMYLNIGYFEQINRGRLKGDWLLDYEYIIVYTAGESSSRATTQALVPQAVMGVLIAIANWYENRLGVTKEAVSGIGSVDYANSWVLPDQAKAVLNPLRKGWLFG